jgi:2-polyprenyl-3-methyl-5-hydroxy-6-metoxy-1,4-benzoquinol methylase
MSQPEYALNNAQFELERKRLDFSESLYDPVTFKRLDAIKVTEGWKCLEVGAGGGSVAKQLAQIVGPKGRVVATDINTRFLQQLNILNLEVRQHNILKDDLETNEYDLVHSRNILEHLREPEKAFRRMVDALRPGGWKFFHSVLCINGMSNTS